MMRSLFELEGVHCVVDGQFGSTGKGALAAYLAEKACYEGPHFAGSIYSGGPNSGHTCYFGDKKIVLKQLPTFSVYAYHHGARIPIYLSAGAVIDREILKKEANEYPEIPIYVHPNAAIVTDEDREAEKTGPIAQVAGTRSGTGEAIVRKVRRMPEAIAKNSLGAIAKNVVLQHHRMRVDEEPYFMEVSQGFSLGINSHFYPKVTSRECTVTQGLADARVAPRWLARTYMAVRTFPIRVGNVDGYSSGDWYEDQEETSWEAIGVTPEITTVTQRIRRVATFSATQFYEAFHANHPDFVFLSHMDYLDRERQLLLLDDLQGFGLEFDLLVSRGPKVTDVIEL